MKSQRQAGYMDMQFTPAMVGAVLLFVVLGLIDNPAFDVHASPFRFYGFLLLAAAFMIYGFWMHLYALGYPESPFNKHTSPVFMTLLCTGPLVYGAYRFYKAGMYPGLVLSGVLAVLVCGASIGFALHRSSGVGPR